jgi:hypothetical protein
MKIKSIKKVPNEAVYNLTVNKYHNYITSSGMVLKNCDALRYFCVNFTYSSVNPPLEKIFNFNFEKSKPNPVGRGDRQNVI